MARKKKEISKKMEEMKALDFTHIEEDNECDYDIPFIPSKVKANIKGNYLPNILTKLGEFDTNTEARIFIRADGVIINGELVHDIDYRLVKHTTILLQMRNIEYEIRLL